MPAHDERIFQAKLVWRVLVEGRYKNTLLIKMRDFDQLRITISVKIANEEKITVTKSYARPGIIQSKLE